MNIRILGTGCYKCLELEMMVAEAVKNLGIKGVELERIDDEKVIQRFITLDAIPGLLINGQLVSERQLPDKETLRVWLSQAELSESRSGPV